MSYDNDLSLAPFRIYFSAGGSHGPSVFVLSSAGRLVFLAAVLMQSKRQNSGDSVSVTGNYMGMQRKKNGEYSRFVS